MNANRVRLIAIACAAIGCSAFQGCEFFDKDKNKTPPAPPVRIIETDPLPPLVDPLPPPILEEIKPVPVAPVTPVRPETRYYTVVKGDTLSEIARREGVRVGDIEAMNAGINPSRLSIGQTIVLPGKGTTGGSESIAPRGGTKTTEVKPLPPPSATPGKDGKSVTYTVVAGDSLSLIANRFGVKVESIRAANKNKIKNDMIRVGQKLTIPDPTKIYTATNGSTTKTVKPTPATSKGSSGSTTGTGTGTGTGTVKAADPKDLIPSGNDPVVPPPPPLGDLNDTLLIPTPPAEPTVPVLAPVNTETTQKFTTYTVKDGEDIVSIALRWGVGFMELKALNNLTESKVPAGTVIKIPIAD